MWACLCDLTVKLCAGMIFLSSTRVNCVHALTFLLPEQDVSMIWLSFTKHMICVWSNSLFRYTWAICMCDPTFRYLSKLRVILLSVTWASCVWSCFLLPEQAACVILLLPEQAVHVILLSVTWASCVWSYCYLSKLRVILLLPEQAACLILLLPEQAACVILLLPEQAACVILLLPEQAACVILLLPEQAACVILLLPEQAVRVILLSVTWASCVCDPTVTWASCVWSYFLLPEQAACVILLLPERAVCVILLSITWASCLNDPKDYWLHDQVVSMIWLSISISVSVYLGKLPAWFNAGTGHALPEKVALCDLTVHLLPVQVSCMITQFGLCILPVQAVYVI